MLSSSEKFRIMRYQRCTYRTVSERVLPQEQPHFIILSVWYEPLYHLWFLVFCVLYIVRCAHRTHRISKARPLYNVYMQCRMQYLPPVTCLLLCVLFLIFVFAFNISFCFCDCDSVCVILRCLAILNWRLCGCWVGNRLHERVISGSLSLGLYSANETSLHVRSAEICSQFELHQDRDDQLKVAQRDVGLRSNYLYIKN